MHARTPNCPASASSPRSAVQKTQRPIDAAAWAAMTAPSAAQKLCDTSDMVIVHRMFRRECALLPQLVAAVAGGDLARARTVAGHAREVLDMLHHHHVGEDELLWPRLSARTRFRNDLLARMDSQHQGLAVLLEHAATAFTAWQNAPTAPTSTALSALLEQLSTGLNEHFDEEEAAVLPIAGTRHHRRRIPGGGPTGTGVDTPDTAPGRAGLPPRRCHPARTNRLPGRHPPHPPDWPTASSEHANTATRPPACAVRFPPEQTTVPDQHPGENRPFPTGSATADRQLMRKRE